MPTINPTKQCIISASLVPLILILISNFYGGKAQTIKKPFMMTLSSATFTALGVTLTATIKEASLSEYKQTCNSVQYILLQ